jgi:predicted DNA binding CopG/RHH family protein
MMISEEELREDQELIDSAERGEWVLAENQEMWKAMLVKTAENTLKKDKRMNVRMSQRDMLLLKTRALEEGIPYQTLVTMVLHKYVTGRLIEKS